MIASLGLGAFVLARSKEKRRQICQPSNLGIKSNQIYFLIAN
jgi:hypothetical protein